MTTGAERLDGLAGRGDLDHPRFAEADPGATDQGAIRRERERPIEVAFSRRDRLAELKRLAPVERRNWAATVVQSDDRWYGSDGALSDGTRIDDRSVAKGQGADFAPGQTRQGRDCLLYTSDAADE